MLVNLLKIRAIYIKKPKDFRIAYKCHEYHIIYSVEIFGLKSENVILFFLIILNTKIKRA